MTQPEHARQSVREIWAGGSGSDDGKSVLKLTSNESYTILVRKCHGQEEAVFTFSAAGFAAGRVSIGLIHATPGDMKSFRSSAERMALMTGSSFGVQRATESE